MYNGRAGNKATNHGAGEGREEEEGEGGEKFEI